MNGDETSSRFNRRAALATIGGLAVASLAACRNHPAPCDACRRPSAQPTPSSTFDRAVATFESLPSVADGPNNEAGELAWDLSYLLLALMRVYQVTRQPQYLHEVVRAADGILARSDRARGVTDYRGRSGPVWRSGGRYTARSARLTSATGVPLMDVRYAGNPGKATVLVEPGSFPDTFSLTLTAPGTRPVQVRDVSTDPRSSRNAMSALLREAYHPGTPWTARLLAQGVPTSGLTTLLPQYNVFAVSTGMISYPLALFARTVLEDRELANGPRRKDAERLLTAAADAVAFHDSEWSDVSEVASGYVARKGSPVPQDGSYLPFNQSNAMGQTLAELYRITGDNKYAAKVERLAASWRWGVRHRTTAGLAWSYWPPFSRVYDGYSADEEVSSYTPIMPAIRRLDDLSHSAITVEFAVAAHGAGVGVTGTDLALLIATYLDQLKSGQASVRSTFGGPVAGRSDAVQCARWLGLGDARIARHVQRVIQRVDPRPITGTAVLSRGYLAWAAGRGLL